MKDLNVVMERLHVQGNSMSPVVGSKSTTPAPDEYLSTKSLDNVMDDHDNYPHGNHMPSHGNKTAVIRRVEYVNQLNNKLVRKMSNDNCKNIMNQFMLTGKAVNTRSKFVNKAPCNTPVQGSQIDVSDNVHVHSKIRINSEPPHEPARPYVSRSMNDLGRSADGSLTLPSLSFGTPFAQYTPGPPGTPAYKMSDVKTTTDPEITDLGNGSISEFSNTNEVLFRRTTNIPKRFRPGSLSKSPRADTNTTAKSCDISDLRSCLHVAHSDEKDKDREKTDEQRLRYHTQFIQRHTYLSNPYKHSKRFKGMPQLKSNYKFNSVDSYLNYNKANRKQTSATSTTETIDLNMNNNSLSQSVKYSDIAREEDLEEYRLKSGFVSRNGSRLPQATSTKAEKQDKEKDAEYWPRDDDGSAT